MKYSTIHDHCAMLLLLAASSRLDIAYTHGCCHLVNFPWNCAPKFGQNSIFERRMLLLHHQMPLLNAQLEGKYKKERKKTSARHIQAQPHSKKNHVRPSKKTSAGVQMRKGYSNSKRLFFLVWTEKRTRIVCRAAPRSICVSFCP